MKTQILDHMTLNNCRTEITTCGITTQLRVNIWFCGEFVWTQRCPSAAAAERVIAQKRSVYLKHYQQLGRVEVG